MRSDYIDYRRLPGQNNLFLDFLYDFDKVSEFYSGPVADLDALASRSEKLLGGSREYPRSALARLLEDFNSRLGCGPRTIQNIERLRSDRVVAIVTGQQLGLFGGPSHVLYKAATAIRLAESLTAAGVEAVPIFWLPSDDSDFDEVKTCAWLDESGGVFRVAYEGLVCPNQMVGTVALDAVQDSFEALRKRRITGRFVDETLERLGQAYRPDGDFRTGFGRWLSSLFRDSGLILFDSLSVGYKELAADVFDTAVQRRSEILSTLDKRNSELREAGYPVQVRTSQTETLLFWLERSCRYKLVGNGSLKAKGSPAKIDLEAISALRDAESFGPNVLLRPILQDTLFPTALYVGGPSEVAYYSQVQAIAPFWGLDPAVRPRAAFTLVDRKSQRLLDRYKLSVLDVMTSSRLDLTRRIVKAGGSADILEGFETFAQDVEGHLGRLENLVGVEDPPVAAMLKGAGKKVLHQIGKVQDRWVRNHEDRASHLKRHLDHLYNHLLPEARLQERVLSYNQFLAMEGMGLTGDLGQSIRPFEAGHQVLYV